MITRQELVQMDRGALMEVLESGHPIDPALLDDTEYRGISLGLPKLVDRLAWKTFKKVFCRDDSGVLRGWNVRIEQGDDIDAPYRPMMRGGTPHTFGHYQVVDAADHRMPCRCAGLLIHYGLGGNGALDVMRRVRDPIVAVNAGSVDLLLGWSYVDVGVTQLGTPSFFSLERDGALTHRVSPPR